MFHSGRHGGTSADGTHRRAPYTHDGNPAGTKILELTWQRERLGKITKFAFNGVRQKTSGTTPRNHTTTFSQASPLRFSTFRERHGDWGREALFCLGRRQCGM